MICNCGDKQYLQHVGGYLTCTTCGAEDTGNSNPYKPGDFEEEFAKNLGIKLSTNNK